MILEKLNEKWREDDDRIMNESLENVEKRQQLVAKEDDNAIQKELLYQRYNVKLIKEIFQYFEDHGQGEDYIKLLAEAEELETGELTSRISEGANDSDTKSDRTSSKIDRISTGTE